MISRGILNLLTILVLFVYPFVGYSSQLNVSNIVNNQDNYDQFNLHIPSSNWKIFDEQSKIGEIKDIRNVDFESSIEHDGAEWSTQFDAHNYYTPDEEDNYQLEINRFYLNYKNKKSGVRTKVGRQASSSTGVVGEIDGITLQIPLSSRFHIGASAGFPVSALEKHKIQDNKPFIVVNSKLPQLYNSVILKPYVAIQHLDGILNRQSIGLEFNFRKSGHSIYQMVDYNTQFNMVNLWLFQGQFRKSNNALYFMTLDYHRNPALELNNALMNETRVSSLKELSTVLSNREIIAQANNYSTKNYSATLGSSFPINSRLQIGADINRYDQVYNTFNSDELNDFEEHNYQNKLSTQLVASNLMGKKDTLSLEYEYTDAKYYDNSTILIRDQIELTGLYQLELEFRMDEGQRNDGELVLTTIPRAMLRCQCSKKLVGGLELGYESWNYSGNTQQDDESWLYTNVNFRLEI